MNQISRIKFPSTMGSGGRTKRRYQCFNKFICTSALRPPAVFCGTFLLSKKYHNLPQKTLYIKNEYILKIASFHFYKNKNRFLCCDTGNGFKGIKILLNFSFYFLYFFKFNIQTTNPAGNQIVE